MLTKIGELEFNTKKKAMEYTRNLIKTLYEEEGEVKINKHHKDFNFFKNLIKRHPDYIEKKGVGISSFIICQNPLNKDSFHMNIKRKDKTFTDFSYRICVNGLPKTHRAELTSALRTSIEPQIMNFRSMAEMECKKCGDKEGILHVDHVNPFDKIYRKFLIGREDIPKTFDSIHDCRRCFKEEDKPFELDWFHYHKENAKFQILCKSCNFKKSNK